MYKGRGSRSATLDTGEIESLAFSHDDTRLAVGGRSSSKVQLWMWRQNNVLLIFQGIRVTLNPLPFHQMVVCSQVVSFSGVIYVWDITSYQ